MLWLWLLLACENQDCAYIPEAREVCLEAGGRWGIQENECGVTECAWPTSDAGTPCTDDSQCEGWCDCEGTEAPFSDSVCSEWSDDFCVTQLQAGDCSSVCY